MFGVSAGDFTAAQARYEDSRIKAGIDLDGATDTPLVKGSQHLAPVLDHGLRQPFLLMGDPATTHKTIASWPVAALHQDPVRPLTADLQATGGGTSLLACCLSRWSWRHFGLWPHAQTLLLSREMTNRRRRSG